jgi:large subunit ribosomal protein L36
MKVRASVKKRSADCKIVRRKGRIYVINKKNFIWHVLLVWIYQEIKEAKLA